MSETIVQTVNPDALVDIFSDLGAAPPSPTDTKPKFGMQEMPVDLFGKSTSLTEQTTQAPAVDPNAATPPAQPTETQPAATPEADILGTAGEPAPPATLLSDLSAYYQDRIKSGKFVAIEDQDDKGNPVPFVPKTAEEYDEVLELQINYRLDQERKSMEQKWYNSKSPAWRAVSQYAELVDDPTQLIPFLQGVRTYTSVANLNENEPEGAERIVRTRLAQNGDPEDVISQQVESLKTTDTLIKTAKAYKPIILQQEQVALQTDLRQRQEEERNYQLLINDIRQNAIKSIESPIFGKTKLRQEEKAAIYDLIAEPAEETQGYGIYSIIDQLFDKGDFAKLTEVALLLSNRDAFMGYFGTNVANATAASLERKLRLAADARTASGNNFHEEGTPKVARNQFKSKPTFGRS